MNGETEIVVAGRVELQAAAGKSGRRLKIVAYTGQPMYIYGYSSPLVVSLEGLEMPTAIPIVGNHKTDLSSIIGGGKPAIKDGAVVVDADVAEVPAGDEVLALLAAGVPLKASIGAKPLAKTDYGVGQQVTANGKTFKAGNEGLTIIGKSRLSEVSIVREGADGNTSVVLARKGAATMAKAKTMPKGAAEDVHDNVQTPEDQIAASQRPDDPIQAAAFDERHRIQRVIRFTTADLPQELQCHADDLRQKGIAGEISEEVIRAGMLKLLYAKLPKGPQVSSGRPRISEAHLTAALMVRAGRIYAKAAEDEFGADVLEQSQELHAASLVDVCRMALQIDGRPCPKDRVDMIRAALSSGSLPVALGDSANKILYAAYIQAPASWRSYATIKRAANFKTQTGIRPTFFGDLVQMGNSSEVKHGSFDEETYEWSIDTFAKQLQIGRKDIVNDDASVFSDVLPSMARAAARTLNKLVAQTILTNAGSFFSAGNNNYFTGAATNLSSASLALAVRMLRQMKDAEGNLLDLVPATLAVPGGLEQTGKELVASSEVQRYVTAYTDRAPMGNSHHKALELAVEPRFDDSAYTGYSATAWYLFSHSSNAGVVVGFLDGKEAPTVETFGLDRDINRLAYGFRVYHDFGAALGDLRAVIKSKGAA